jgi:hypothetical protein
MAAFCASPCLPVRAASRFDLLLRPTGQGFSGDARPSGPRWRLTGLPGPTKDCSGPRCRRGRVSSHSWCRHASEPIGSSTLVRHIHCHPATCTLGGMASTRLPAHVALPAKIMRKAYHPTSWMDVLRPALRLAPFGRWPPFSSGFGWGRLHRLRICKSSRLMVSYSHTRADAVL